MRDSITIAHIINPVKVSERSDLYRSQPVTFETMRVASEYSALKDHGVEVQLFAAYFPEDEPFIPPLFTKTPPLDRSVPDMGRFVKTRKLPLLVDILDRLHDAAPSADYYVYTNADIALLPHFYLSVAGFVRDGYDAFVINRRTLPIDAMEIADLPKLYAQIGETHIGHDCFVFRGEAYPRYRLGHVGIGIRLVGRVLIWNLIAQAKKFKEFKDLHLTFHFGQDKPWQNPDYKDYDAHNHREAVAVLRQLTDEHNLLSVLREHYPEFLVAVDWSGV